MSYRIIVYYNEGVLLQRTLVVWTIRIKSLRSDTLTERIDIDENHTDTRYIFCQPNNMLAEMQFTF